MGPDVLQRQRAAVNLTESIDTHLELMAKGVFMARGFWLLGLAFGSVAALSGQAPNVNKNDQPYELVENWMKPVEDGMLIHPVSVFPESPDRVFVALVGVTPHATVPEGLGSFDYKVPGVKVAHQISVLNRKGEIIERWSQWEQRVGSIHEITMNPYDPERHLWVIDRGSQQVLKFTNDGKRLVMELGTRGVVGKDEKHFAQPSDIAWLPDGTFFVADGDSMRTSMKGNAVELINTRVVKFDKNGKYLAAWETGTPGQALHGIGVDAQRRVYVAERGKAGQRMLVFDENGKRLNTWEFKDVERPWLTNDGVLWAGHEGGLAKYDLNGKLLTTIHTPGDVGNGRLLGRFAKTSDDVSPHDWAVDCEGNLYVQGSSKHVTHKLVPKPGADRSRLVGSRLGDCRAR